MAITTQDKIAGLYAAFFNRAPDKVGFDSWVTKLNDGTNTLDDIAHGFASHSMFTSTYGSLTNEEFVTAVYTNMTGSAGDTAGVAYYAGALDSGAFSSRADMVSNFVQTVLTTDLNDSKYDSLAEADKTAAQNRQDQLINKTIVSQEFINKLEEMTNPIDGASLDTEPAYLASIKILSQITHEPVTVTNAKDTLTLLSQNKAEALTILNKLTDISTADLLKTASPAISSITLSDGNYTPGAIVDIVVTFTQDIIISDIDSKIKLTIGEYEKEAIYSSKTANTITYKYTVEDGIADVEKTISIPENAIILNNTTIKNKYQYNSLINNESIQNANAIVIDNKAPNISVQSAYYTHNTDKLVLNGSGFSSILEKNEVDAVDLSARFDFTKLVWDIDGDEVSPNSTIVTLSNADVKLIKIESDTELSIVFNTDYTAIESATNYGHSLGASVDTLDINTGFIIDKIGNISTAAPINNIVLGIDNIYYGSTAKDTITGTSNNDTITSDLGNDTIYGLGGNDTINAGAGDDIIVGGAGIDTLTGGAGSDTFTFSTHANDSVIAFSTIEGIDKITDLVVDGATADKIDLDITVSAVNTSVIGTANQATFISDLNTLLSVSTNGFNKDIAADISASFVSVNGGDLTGKTYLVVDADKNDIFTENDFVVDITGVTITNFTTAFFL